MELIENGNVPIPVEGNKLAPMWNWLAANAGGDSIRFVKDGVYNFDWDTKTEKQEMQRLLERLRTRKDAELLIVM
jgi:tellurite resistance protein